MQNYTNHDTGHWKALQLTKSMLLVVGCLLLWFLPLTSDLCRLIDRETFKFLNHTLTYSHAWQLWWGYLNHPYETWLNLIFMVTLNLVALYSLPAYKRPKAFAMLLYFWFFFQFVLLFTHKFFADFLDIHRDSPSLIITPFVVLSESLGMHLKVASCHCFPAGHALVLVFWAKFTKLYAPRWINILAMITVIVLSLPRLFSGAHWLSDIIFTIFYALLWFNIAVGTPLYSYGIEQVQRFLGFIVSRNKKLAGEV